MAKSNAEYQRDYMARLKARAAMPLNLGADLEDRIPVQQEQLTPLEYMLRVMNDPNAEKGRRDKMALAAAQYIHPKIEASLPTKKEQKNLAAEEASEGKFAPAEPPKIQSEQPTIEQPVAYN